MSSVCSSGGFHPFWSDIIINDECHVSVVVILLTLCDFAREREREFAIVNSGPIQKQTPKLALWAPIIPGIILLASAKCTNYRNFDCQFQFKVFDSAFRPDCNFVLSPNFGGLKVDNSISWTATVLVLPKWNRFYFWQRCRFFSDTLRMWDTRINK